MNSKNKSSFRFLPDRYVPSQTFSSTLPLLRQCFMLSAPDFTLLKTESCVQNHEGIPTFPAQNWKFKTPAQGTPITMILVYLSMFLRSRNPIDNMCNIITYIFMMKICIR